MKFHVLMRSICCEHSVRETPFLRKFGTLCHLAAWTGQSMFIWDRLRALYWLKSSLNTRTSTYSYLTNDPRYKKGTLALRAKLVTS